MRWQPLDDAIAYRVYSDMGTGYGVYVFKAETEQPTLTDSYLRPGLTYQYRVGAVTSKGEVALAWADGATSGGAASMSTGSTAAVSLASPPQPTAPPVRVTPAPTPLPPDTIILGLLSATDYANDVDNTLTIVGEVRNDSQLDVGDTAVAVTFYADDSQVIGEVSGTTMLRELAPGVRSPFMITLPRPDGLANYSLRATGRPVSRDRRTDLSVVNTRRFEDNTGFYHVAGVVENPEDERVEQARVIVTLYDRAGRVVNVGFAYPRPASLAAGERADFDIAFTYYPKVFSHMALAVGD